MPALNSGFEYRKVLGANAAGVRLIDYLVRHYPRFTEKEWLDRIDASRVLVDGIACDQDMVLEAGRILTWVRPPWEEPIVPLSFAILYKDEYLLGVAKPSGLPTLPGGGSFMENTLFHLVRRHFPAANPLHRLGRGTSGIVLFALSREAASRLSREWQSAGFLKVYRALVTGCPAENEFDVTAPIGPVPYKMLKTIHAATPDGKPAFSHVKVISRRADCSLVDVVITTGRPHQIRIHLAAAGHPLVGDPLYVAGGIPGENSCALPGTPGYFLHNRRLKLRHPITNDWIEIECRPPGMLRD